MMNEVGGECSLLGGTSVATEIVESCNVCSEDEFKMRVVVLLKE